MLASTGISLNTFFHLRDIDQPTLSNKGTTVLRILMTALSKVLDEATNFSEDFKIAVSKKSGISRRQEPTVKIFISFVSLAITMQSSKLPHVSVFWCSNYCQPNIKEGYYYHYHYN